MLKVDTDWPSVDWKKFTRTKNNCISLIKDDKKLKLMAKKILWGRKKHYHSFNVLL